MKKTFLFLILVLLPTFLSGQIIFSEPNNFKPEVKPWITNQPRDYQAEYQFGFSQDESYFVLIMTDDSCYAQYQYFNWGKGVFMKFVNLKNVRIEGNKFFSDQTNGEFVIYECDNKSYKGLVIYKPWSHGLKPGESEIGPVRCSLEVHYGGIYPYASTRLLKKDELGKMTLADLQMMRKEIYKRYQYVLNPNGEVLYFKDASGDSGQYPKISDLLTGLEKQNINLILATEKTKNSL
jgi:hypothetical protein